MPFSLLRFAGVCGLAFVWASSFAVQAKEHDPGMQGDHYVCYDVTPEQKFRPVDVTLKDQFQSWGASVVIAQSVCTPVSKNGSPVDNERLHMVCYRIESAQDKAVDRIVEMTNQFGKSRYRVDKATTLCVPSYKRVLK